MLGKIRMASGRKRILEHVLLALVATSMRWAVFCWQCFSDLGLALIVYLCCLHVSAGKLVGTAWSLL